MTQTATEKLAEFATSVTYDQLPPPVVATVTRHILDAVGVGIAAANVPHSRAIREYAISESPPGTASLFGDAARLRPGYAALANASAIHGIEGDDYHVRALTHPGCVSVPVALALGEHLGTRGQAIIASVAVGMETTLRFGRALMPSLIADRGFHETCVTGVFGATASAALISGLSADVTTHALGIAASLASGTTEFARTGGEVKRLHAGLAAAGGIQACSLARLGLTAPRTAVDGARGTLQAFADHSDPAALTDSLGSHWELLTSAIKPSCCCGALIGPVSFAKALMDEHALKPADVESVELALDAVSRRHVGSIGAAPTDLVSAQMSAHYSVGMALAGRGNDIGAYIAQESDGFSDPAVADLAGRVSLVAYPEADAVLHDRMLSRVTITARDGETVSRTGEAPGSAGSPLTDAEVSDKFMALVGPVLGSAAATQLCGRITSLADDGALTGLFDASSLTRRHCDATPLDATSR